MNMVLLHVLDIRLCDLTRTHHHTHLTDASTLILLALLLILSLVSVVRFLYHSFMFLSSLAFDVECNFDWVFNVWLIENWIGHSLFLSWLLHWFNSLMLWSFMFLRSLGWFVWFGGGWTLDLGWVLINRYLLMERFLELIMSLPMEYWALVSTITIQFPCFCSKRVVFILIGNPLKIQSVHLWCYQIWFRSFMGILISFMIWFRQLRVEMSTLAVCDRVHIYSFELCMAWRDLKWPWIMGNSLPLWTIWHGLGYVEMWVRFTHSIPEITSRSNWITNNARSLKPLMSHRSFFAEEFMIWFCKPILFDRVNWRGNIHLSSYNWVFFSSSADCHLSAYAPRLPFKCDLSYLLYGL